MLHDRQLLENALPASEPRASFAMLAIVIAVFATAFFVNEVDWEASTYENYAVSPDEAEDQVAVGKSSRKVAYITIGLVGALMTVLPSRQRVRLFNLPFVLLCVYVLFCIASFIWSDAAWLTTKRLGIAIFGLLAFIGAARQLSLRDIIDVALGIGMILLAISIYVELSLGTFAPFAGEYRFAGIVHPNTQGSACGVMVIAAFFAMKTSRRGKWFYMGIFLLAATFLLLSKSRTSVAACLLGVSAAWYLVTSRHNRTLVGLGLPAAICAGLLALLLLGFELSSSATTAARFGRGAEADLATLNGRVPLWSSLLEPISQRPLLGYGYHGFWTPDRIYEVSLEQEWTVPTAHSVLLDVVLSTGLLGGTIFVFGVLVTCRRTATRCLETNAPTDGFVFALFVYAFVGSIFESGFSQPNGFEPFITGTALLHLVSLKPHPEPAGQTILDADEASPKWQTASAGGRA